MIRLIMKQGRTVLFSSHILSDVERVSSQLVVIDKGRLRAHCSIDQFRESIQKVKLSFSNSVPTDIDIEGLLNHRVYGNELELILVATSQEKVAQWAASAGAENFEMIPMNMEDQFIEFTEPKKREKLFQWEIN
jgi:ABC-2 type transport system ATP-binding protein